MKLGPVIATGSTMVLKTAPETPLHGRLIGECAKEAGIPDGVINVVSADRAGSEYLVRHPDIDKVSFTGSALTGSIVASICGEQIKRCTLELGGKSAGIILDDVDLDAVMNDLVMSGMLNTGQACGAQTRILVPTTATTRSSKHSPLPSARSCTGIRPTRTWCSVRSSRAVSTRKSVATSRRARQPVPSP